MALQLHKYMDANQICNVLALAVEDCGRDVPSDEIWNAVKNSMKLPNLPQQKPPFKGTQRNGKWAAVNNCARAEVIAKHPHAKIELAYNSPVLVTDNNPDATWFVQKLYHPDDLLCIGNSVKDTRATPLSIIVRHKLEICLMVPSPMSSRTGHTQNGKVSERCLDNTGPRRYLVTEFDTGTSDEQAGVIYHLMEYCPLVMVLWSGNRSLHAWWNCDGADDLKQRNFFNYAVSLGADPATWTRSQLVRSPQGWRTEKAVRQAVLYFNPSQVNTSRDLEVVP
jgi:hypothetical protein